MEAEASNSSSPWSNWRPRESPPTYTYDTYEKKAPELYCGKDDWLKPPGIQQQEKQEPKKEDGETTWRGWKSRDLDASRSWWTSPSWMSWRSRAAGERL